jgi:hypothetical protein
MPAHRQVKERVARADHRSSANFKRCECYPRRIVLGRRWEYLQRVKAPEQIGFCQIDPDDDRNTEDRCEL